MAPITTRLITYLILHDVITSVTSQDATTMTSQSKPSCPNGLPCVCNTVAFMWGMGVHMYVSCRNLGLTHVPDLSALQGMPIHELDLSHNHIDALRDDEFSGLFFHCMPHQTSVLRLNDNPLTHMSDHAFRHVRAAGLNLVLSNCKLSTMPVQALQQIQVLTSLYINNNDLKSVEGEVFSSFSSLVHLDLSDNDLTQMSPNVFHGLEHVLSSLDLHNTGLSSFPLTALKGLTKLTHLNLDQNNIKYLPPHIFDGFKSDNDSFYLSMKGNGLKDIAADAFSNNNNKLEVEKLHLENNDISNLSFLYKPCSLMLKPSHATVYLASNPLTCDCIFYSLSITGIFNIQGKCDTFGPHRHVTFEVEVTSAVQHGQEQLRGNLRRFAENYCKPVNTSMWELACIKSLPKTSSGTFFTLSVPSLCLVQVILLLLYDIKMRHF